MKKIICVLTIFCIVINLSSQQSISFPLDNVDRFVIKKGLADSTTIIDFSRGNNFLIGKNQGDQISTGIDNLGIGFYTLENLHTGSLNTAVGHFSQSANQSGSGNSSFGIASLSQNSTGFDNTAVGRSALGLNSVGGNNTALGYRTLWSNKAGQNNIAIGNMALYNNQNGFQNIGIVDRALNNVQSGSINIALGLQSMHNLISGYDNIGIGSGALYSNIIGNGNVAIGQESLYKMPECQQNIAIGVHAGRDQKQGDTSIIVGFDAQVPDLNGNNQERIGNNDISYAGIAIPLTITSDRRAKKEITQSDLGLDFINDLNPVSYIRIKDQEKSKEYGFIAQEIEAIFLSKGVGKTSFIKVDDKGNYSLRYNDLIAILVKANQELSNKINKQGAVIESLSLKLDKLNRQFKELYNELALKD